MGACFLFPDHWRAKLRSPDAFWWYNPSDETHTLDRVEPIDHNTDNNRTGQRSKYNRFLGRQVGGALVSACVKQERQ
jgi:hypothetical protein